MDPTYIRALLVEDNPDDAALLCETLSEISDLELEIHPAATLEAARRFLAHADCDIILLDLNLPDSTGLETVLRIRAEAPYSSIVVLTGLDDDDLAFRAADLGANDYIVKGSTTPASLARTLRFAVKRAREEADLRQRHIELEQVIEARARELLEKDSQLKREIAGRKSLEREQQLLAEAVANADDPVIITDVTGAIEYVNAAFERYTGYGRDEVLGLNPRFLKSGEHGPDFYREMYDTIQNGKTWRGRLINRKKSGDLCVFDSTITSTKKPDGSIEKYVMVSRDNTFLVDLQAQLDRSLRLELLGHLAGGIAHDFNNILQAIMGFGSFLLERTSDDPESYECANGIFEAATRAANLTRQLLAFGSRQVLKREVVQPNDLIASTAKMLSRLIGENIRLELNLARDLPAVEIDIGQIEQILVNLCVNARDAIEGTGRIVISTRQIRLDRAFCERNPWAKPGDFVCLGVMDTGAGMSPEVLPRIYEPFYTTKGEGRGTGLGLATVYGIVQQLDGLIQCESSVGKGTSFSIYLPAYTPPEGAQVVGRNAESSSHNSDTSGTEHILVAEDEPVVASLVTRVLQQAGFTVVCARDGAEAAGHFMNTTQPFDLIVTDLVMPEMGGIALLNAVRDSGRPVPKFLFCSGYSRTIPGGDLTRGLEFQYLQKPYSPRDLLRVVRELLDSH